MRMSLLQRALVGVVREKAQLLTVVACRIAGWMGIFCRKRTGALLGLFLNNCLDVCRTCDQAALQHISGGAITKYHSLAY